MIPLLFGQRAISQHAPLPVDILDESSSVASGSETVTFVVASTGVNSAGEAAGTVIFGRVAQSGILDSAHSRVGHSKDTSFAFGTGTCLTTQVAFPKTDWEQLSMDETATRASKMAEMGSRLANGEFMLDHRTGLLIGKKATTADNDTATYKYRTSATVVGGTVTVDTELAAAAALADAAANPTTATLGAAMLLFNGTTFDRARGDITNGLDVDVTRIIPGTTATALGKAEDAAHTTGDTGVQILAVRKDTAAALADTDGDYAPLEIDANGRLHVLDANSAAAAASLSVLDDWDESDRAKVNLIVGVAGVSAGAGAVDTGTQRMTHASDDPVTVALQLIDDGVATIASATPTKGMVAIGHDGTNARALKTDTSGELQVDVLTMPTITETNSGAALTALQLIDDAVFTDDAAFTPGTSKGLILMAQADETSADSVDEGDAGALRMTLDRRLRVASKATDGPGEPTIDSYTSAAISAAANTANQSLIAAPGANKQIWVYGFSATTTLAGSMSLQDEDDTALSGVMPFGATGGISIPPSGNFSMPLFKVATNKALEIDTVTADAKGIIQYAIVSV